MEHRLLDEIHVQNPLFDEVVERYREYKRQYVKNIGFNEAAYSTMFGEFQSWSFNSHCLMCEGVELANSSVQLVQIYFDPASYDETERDKKIKFEAQLSLIGGTMGLLTGFSIISGIEIIFFLFRLINFTNFIIDYYLSLGWLAHSGSGGLML